MPGKEFQLLSNTRMMVGEKKKWQSSYRRCWLNHNKEMINKIIQAYYVKADPDKHWKTQGKEVNRWKTEKKTDKVARDKTNDPIRNKKCTKKDTMTVTV